MSASLQTCRPVMPNSRTGNGRSWILPSRAPQNKEIAASLGISPRTVEHYRESAMERMQATRLAELVYMAVRLKRYATAAERERRPS